MIISPITNDSSTKAVEDYGRVVDMDSVFDEGFTRDFCDGQTSPVPPRWADDDSGMLYTYSEGAAQAFSEQLQADLAERIASGAVNVNPSWLGAASRLIGAIETAKLLPKVEKLAAVGLTESQMTTAINNAIAAGATTEAEIIEWIRQNARWASAEL